MAKCLYDGGDCCKEVVKTHLCQECLCILDIADGEMEQLVDDYSIMTFPLQEPEPEVDFIAKFYHVVSGEICAKLCIETMREAQAMSTGDDEEEDEQIQARKTINSWYYDGDHTNDTCACTYFGACFNETRFDEGLEVKGLSENLLGFALTSVMLPCRKIYIDS